MCYMNPAGARLCVCVRVPVCVLEEHPQKTAGGTEVTEETSSESEKERLRR